MRITCCVTGKKKEERMPRDETGVQAAGLMIFSEASLRLSQRPFAEFTLSKIEGFRVTLT